MFRRPGPLGRCPGAPSTDSLTLHLGDEVPLRMVRGADGVHRAQVEATEGTRYAFSTIGAPIADPASLQQETGVEGWSILRDPSHFGGGGTASPSRPFDERVICELHIGSFTPEGTFRAGAR